MFRIKGLSFVYVLIHIIGIVQISRVLNILFKNLEDSVKCLIVLASQFQNNTCKNKMGEQIILSFNLFMGNRSSFKVHLNFFVELHPIIRGRITFYADFISIKCLTSRLKPEL